MTSLVYETDITENEEQGYKTITSTHKNLDKYSLRKLISILINFILYFLNASLFFKSDDSEKNRATQLSRAHFC
jgi:hypothetical protein